MKEHENGFSPEAIDAQTERWSSGLSEDERRLIQALYASSQAYARENEQSLERIWQRFVQCQGHPALLQETQHERPEGEQFLREGKTMREDIYQGTRYTAPASLPEKRPRRALRRTLSTVVAVAVVLVLIVSWVLLSSGLRQLTRHNSPVTRTGAAQKVLSSGTLLCSFADDRTGYPVPIQPTLDWSSSRQLAVTYHNLKTVSAQDCATKSANVLPQAQQATWSPDGKRLLVLTGTNEAKVLDARTGRVIASFQGNVPGNSVEQSAWLSNETVVSAVQTANPKAGDFATSGVASSILMQIWNAGTGALIRTAITFSPGEQLLGLDVSMLPISPNGKYVVVQKVNGGVEVWNIVSGKLVNSIAYHQPANQVSVSALAWSPDGAFLALGLPDTPVVQIWSVATGQLTASFTDNDTWAKVIGALAWSPNGKYLAESGSAIHIWDVKAQKIVATFGKVDKPAYIPTLAWSLDSTMFASTTNNAATPGQKALLQNTVNVWKLS
ncbi:MAG TPA: hypothetical protein VFB60_17420 [Ktedonobacteraceae bacterium]|nr:hypothetical protein [Ktedonobacteraceae bacterium]